MNAKYRGNLKTIIALAALALWSVLFADHRAHARNPPLTSLEALLSDDPAVRRTAFYQLLPVSSGSPDNIKAAVIDLLTREIFYRRPYELEGLDLGDEYTTYFGDLAVTVVSLRDDRAIAGLAEIIDSGSLVTTALADFAPASIDPVILQLHDPDETIRNGAAISLVQMVVPTRFVTLDPAAVNTVVSALNMAVLDADPDVHTNAANGLEAVAQLQLPAATPSSSAACNGVFNGTYVGSLLVQHGQRCIFVGGGVDGKVTQKGGVLILAKAQVRGNVKIHGGGTFSIGPSTVVDGNIEIHNLPTDEAQSHLCAATITGNVAVHNNDAPVGIGTKAAVGSCAGNTIRGNVEVHNNTAAMNIVGNTVGGNVQVMKNAETLTFDNRITRNLQCKGNSALTGDGNTAKRKEGQCAGF